MHNFDLTRQNKEKERKKIESDRKKNIDELNVLIKKLAFELDRWKFKLNDRNMYRLQYAKTNELQATWNGVRIEKEIYFSRINE